MCGFAQEADGRMETIGDYMSKNNTFNKYGLSPDIRRAIDSMGFQDATPVQDKTIRPFLDGLDLIVQAPTGTGKTCAFGIPLSQTVDTRSRDAQVLILSPTRELAIQTSKVIQKLTRYKENVRIATLYGGENIQKQFAALRRHPQVVIATPGRLLDHIERRTVKLGAVKTVVLDEADRMLDMGFRKDMDKILKTVPAKRQTVLFSATLSKEIMAITKNYQYKAKHIAIRQDALTVKSVEQYYTTVNTGGKKGELLALLENSAYTTSLVFVNTKRMADRLCDGLRKSGYSAGALHGDMKQQQRDKIMRSYRSGNLEILVATDVAARGIDVSNIDVVVNYDIPNDSDSYVHRIGRTGRANQCGIAHTFIYKQETGKLKAMMRDTHAVITPTRSAMAATV